MDRPSYPTDISSRFERDWPDARGLWLSDDKSLVAHVNRRDHILLSVVVKDGEIGKAFGRLVDYVKEVTIL
jgi:protein-arginine kinase